MIVYYIRKGAHRLKKAIFEQSKDKMKLVRGENYMNNNENKTDMDTFKNHTSCSDSAIFTGSDDPSRNGIANGKMLADSNGNTGEFNGDGVNVGNKAERGHEKPQNGHVKVETASNTDSDLENMNVEVKDKRPGLLRRGQLQLVWLCETSAFSTIIMVSIFINTVTMACEHHGQV